MPAYHTRYAPLPKCGMLTAPRELLTHLVELPKESGKLVIKALEYAMAELQASDDTERDVSMPELEYCFIVNPAAKGGFSGRNWPKLQAQLRAANIAHCHYISERKGHSRDLARDALQAGYKNLVAVGGDGTANGVLNGLFAASSLNATEVSLSIIPWGTGNDWASYYGFSPRLEDCVQLLQAGSNTLQDIGKANFTDSAGNHRTHYFLNCAGTGFDSYLLAQMGASRGSRSRYFLYVLKCLRKFRATSLQLDIDAESLEYSALMLEICLGKYAGAGMQFAPAAVADDGLFEVLLIEDLSIPQLLGSLFYLYNGRINEHSAVRHWQCRSISVATTAEQHFHCDGELVGQLPIQIGILPQALRVITP